MAQVIGEEKIQEQDERVATNEDGHLTTIKVNGKEVKVVNSVCVMQIMVHKLENGQEASQVIAHEFMMVDHKRYLVRLLTEAINTVMRAEKRKPLIHLATEAIVNRLRREHNSGKGAFGGKK